MAPLGLFGRHVQAGITTKAEGGYVPLPTALMARKEIEFVGSHGMPPTRYDELLGTATRDRLHPQAVVSRTVSVDDLNDRLAAMTDYGTEGIEVITEF